MSRVSAILIIAILALAVAAPAAAADAAGRPASGGHDLLGARPPTGLSDQGVASKMSRQQNGWETSQIVGATLAHLATREEIEELKATIGTREAGRSYTTIVNGRGTGLAPPTEDEWEAAVGWLRIVDSVWLSAPPTSVDLSQEPYFPPVRSQGSQSSCASWAAAYYASGYLQAKDNGWTDASTGNNDHLMSPAWVYNKINNGTDNGSTLLAPIGLMQNVGCATWSTMPYSELDYTDWGSELAWRSAPEYRVADYEVALASSTDFIKAWLEAGYPCLMALNADQYEAGLGPGDDTITSSEYTPGDPNHANTIVGYDDTKSDGDETGAFKIVNSWGADWGTDWGGHGFYWMTYDAVAELEHFVVRFYDKVDYEPSLLGVWSLDPAASRDAPVTLGIGNHTSPEETRLPGWDGGAGDYPSFMCLDITEFEDEWDAGTLTFFLEIGAGSGSGTVTSFKVECYQDSYVPASPTRISRESPSTPAETPDYVTLGFSLPEVAMYDVPDLVTALTNVSGTASTNSELDRVEVQIEKGSSSYWNGSLWQGTAAWVNATGTASWACAMPSLEDEYYTVRVRSLDKEGYYSTQASDTFVHDGTSPTVIATDIPDFLKSLTNISGTAEDNMSGLDRITILIEDGDNVTFWDGDSWAAAETWLGATGTVSWGYDTAGVGWTNGHAYQVTARAEDKAGNCSVDAWDSFVFDAASPTIGIDDFDDFVSSLAWINGTAADTAPGELEGVQVQLSKGAGSTYWNGSEWQEAAVWLDATGTTSWSYAVSGCEEADYAVKARSIDEAGNVSTEAGDSFAYDGTQPQVDMEGIADAVNSLTLVSGTAADGRSGVTLVTVLIKDDEADRYWDGDSWVAADTWLDASGTTSWSYDTSGISWASGHIYTATARSTDGAGNLSGAVSDTFIFDDISPTATIDDIPDSVERLDLISGTASDTSSGEPVKVLVLIHDSTDNSYWDGNGWTATETWLDASGTTSWSRGTASVRFVEGNAYVVRAKCIDTAENTSTEVSDGFTFAVASGLFDCACSCRPAETSPAGLLIGCAAFGLCWGTGLLFLKKGSRSDTKRRS